MEMILQAIVVCVLLSVAACSLQPPVISIPRLGLLRGNATRSFFTKRPLYEFYGINYAKPPSGERRFKPPEESGPWNGVYNATKMRQRCPQIDQAYYPSPDSDKLDVKKDIEDCLVVNVFTPDLNAYKGIPVMFYIHGGSFYLGSAYDFLPNFLLEEDVVLVVPQYRLGPLGFLFLNTSDIPGNMGMLDILLALRWVKTYIQHFGGDPSKITVVGQSAGAAAASSLLISPLVEKGLINKMIIQSGSVLSLWAVDDDPLKSARSIAQIAGCETDDLDKMTACLKTLPALDLVKAHGKHIYQDMATGGRGIGGNSLVVQGSSPVAYLDRHPCDIFPEGRYIRIPVMGGSTRDEGTGFLASLYDSKMNLIHHPDYFHRNFTGDLLKLFGFEDRRGILNDAYRSLYLGSGLIELKDLYPGLVDMCSVLLIKQSTFDLLRRVSHTQLSYAYSFDFYGGVSKLRASEPKWDKKYPFPAGVGHSDELGYLFPSLQHNYTPRELNMVHTMTMFWTSFVRTGYPEVPRGGFTWPLISTEYGPYLRITDFPEKRDSYLEEFTIATREGFLSGSSPTARTSLLNALCFIIGVIILR